MFARHGFKHERLQHSIDFLIVIDVWGQRTVRWRHISVCESDHYSSSVIWKKPECITYTLCSVVIKYTSVTAKIMYCPRRKQEFKHHISKMSVHFGAIEVE